MDKKGAEKLLAIYWFVILILVTSGIYLMTAAYYSHPTDVRELEVNAFSNKVADCISKNGELILPLNEVGEISESFIQNFLQECHFTSDVGNFGQKGEYYLEINFFTINENQLYGKIIKGNKEIKTDCEIKEKAFHLLPTCLNRRFYSLKDPQEQVLIEIFTGIKKSEKNVKG